MSRDDDEATEASNPGTVTEAQPVEGSATENATPENTSTPEAGASEAAAAPEAAKPEGPTEAEQAAAFDAFKTKVDAAIEVLDKSTGNIPDGPVAEVRAAYVALPLPKNKKAARDFLDTNMKASLTKPPFDPWKAKAYLDLGEAVKSTGATRETVAKPPVDPTDAFVNQVAAHWIATSLLVAGPEVDASYVTKAQTLVKSLEGESAAFKTYLVEYAAWLAKPEAERGDEPQAPEVSQVVLHAAKIATGRTRKTTVTKAADGTTVTKAAPTGVGYTGPRRDVKKHIINAFQGKPVGTFLKIGEIAKTPSAEYGSDTPSGGAINAALESAKFAEAVSHIVKDTENGVGGARKVAE